MLRGCITRSLSLIRQYAYARLGPRPFGGRVSLGGRSRLARKSSTAARGARERSTPAAQSWMIGRRNSSGSARSPTRRLWPAAGGELRHLQKLQRLAELVGIDALALFELADVALRERVEARGQRAALELRARPRGRHQVVGARRQRRPLPAVVAGPAADAGVAHAGARPDLAIAERAVFDQAAHLRERGVGVRLARAARPHRHGVRVVVVGRDADPGDGRRREGRAHDKEYSPDTGAAQGRAGDVARRMLRFEGVRAAIRPSPLWGRVDARH